MLSLTEENVRIACKEMIDKLKLKMEWKFLSFMVQEGKEVKKKIHCCFVHFSIGKDYDDEIWCDVVPINTCYLFWEDHGVR